jgi:hypothetical protein
MTAQRAERRSAGSFARMGILGGGLGAMIVGSTLERALIGLIAGLIVGFVTYLATTRRREAETHARTRSQLVRARPA